ncbi:MAG: hypothetical protein M1819_003584 [Sarea resinae]|nr:MAG: hypothetical protein M1819_003584 [Sarea resinae]
MAGLEQLEIRSKSYLVRWVNVSAGHTISWSIQPHKKSINFGLFKHPGTGNSLTPNLSTFEASESPRLASNKARAPSPTRNASASVQDKLQNIGYKLVSWVGKCEAAKVSTGHYDVPADGTGMYALVFDNTFSKGTSKTVTFILLTYPTNAPPQSTHHIHHLQAGAAENANALAGKRSPRLGPANDSSDTLANSDTTSQRRPCSSHNQASPPGFYTGILQKRRRKRHQGFAKRFFSLDFTSCTLSYYHNHHSSALRGSIPLALAAIGANEQTREISVDSGAEVWHLKANSQKDFEGWRLALEQASSSAANASGAPSQAGVPASVSPAHKIADEKEWSQVETLVSRVAGTRDAVRRLAKDTDPKYTSPTGLGIDTMAISDNADAVSMDGARDDGRQSFWKRKLSNGNAPPNLSRRSTQPGISSPPMPQSNGSSSNTLQVPGQYKPESDVHDRCMAILNDLNSVISEFSKLLSTSKRRRMPELSQVSSRYSIESTSSQEFFDAEVGDAEASQLLKIRAGSDYEASADEVADDDDSSGSDGEGTESVRGRPSADLLGSASPFPPRPKSLSPLPQPPVSRRTTVPAATTLPPSLIGFLRKNVGKDLSTLAMPVSSNEPLSLLQRAAEHMEYTSVLDAAVAASPKDGLRLLHIAAFAISYYSVARVKDRAIRKPFNPMLGETYELVREDRGFRFVAEKVCHRPVILACAAESKDWSMLQSPTPTQKFWGKSVELITEGRARVALHGSGDHYSWNGATSFLRNILAGEKYIEPVGSMTVVNETTGEKAIATFKAAGMFSGRSEDVVVAAYAPDGAEYPLGLAGKWTSHLALTTHGSGAETGPRLWETGPLVENAPARYGFTAFTATLNEITPLERGVLPPSDSRLRPDQRAAEQGHLDRAEELKHRLEEAQRVRRRQMEDSGETWSPRWFVRKEVGGAGGGGEEVWQLREGGGYWDVREKAAAAAATPGSGRDKRERERDRGEKSGEKSGAVSGAWEDVVPVFDYEACGC